MSLSEARKSIGISQKKLAELLDVSQSQISKVERGEYVGTVYKKYLEWLSRNGVDMNQVFKENL